MDKNLAKLCLVVLTGYMMSCRCCADTEISNFQLEIGCNSLKVLATATSDEINNYTVRFYVKDGMDKTFLGSVLANVADDTIVVTSSETSSNYNFETKKAPNISTIEITLKFRFGEDFLFPCNLTFEVKNSDNETIERPVCPNGADDAEIQIRCGSLSTIILGLGKIFDSCQHEEDYFIASRELPSDPSTVDENCVTSMQNRTFVLGESDCDAYVQELDDRLEYTWTIRNMPFSSPSPVQRFVSYCFNVTCVFDENEIVNSDPFETNLKKTQLTSIADNGSLELSLLLFKDSHFNCPIHNGGIVDIPEYVYAKLPLEDKPYLHIQIDCCWATPSPDPDDETKYLLIRNGCPVNNYVFDDPSVLLIRNFLPQYAAFKFRSFQWKDGHNMVHIHCKVEFCDWKTSGYAECSRLKCAPCKPNRIEPPYYPFKSIPFFKQARIHHNHINSLYQSSYYFAPVEYVPKPLYGSRLYYFRPPVTIHKDPQAQYRCRKDDFPCDFMGLNCDFDPAPKRKRRSVVPNISTQVVGTVQVDGELCSMQLEDGQGGCSDLCTIYSGAAICLCYEGRILGGDLKNCVDDSTDTKSYSKMT